MKIDRKSAEDYDDRTTNAVKSALVEVGQILGSFRGKFAVVGGAVPWLLLSNEEMPHVGTLDIDLGLDAESLGDGEYARLVESLQKQGYEQRTDLRRFQLVRAVPAHDGGEPIDVVVDFLMPRNADIEKNTPPIIENFAVQRADGLDLIKNFYKLVAVEGTMPQGAKNKVEIAVCSIPALLAMKGFAINDRLKQKDSYDIYYCVRNYDGGIDELVKDCEPLMEHESATKGYTYINNKFDAIDGFGPSCVAEFVKDSRLMGGRSEIQWKTDAFGQVDAWLRGLGLRIS